MTATRIPLLAVLSCLLLAPAAAAQTPPAAPAPPPPAAPAPPAPVPPAPVPPPPPAEPRIAPGVLAAGVDVGGLTVAEATLRLRETVGTRVRRNVFVAVAGRRYKLTMRRAQLRFSAGRTARRALRKAPEGPPVAPGLNVAPAIAFSRAAIGRFADRVDRATHVRARDATVRITLRRILTRRSRTGRDLDARALRRAVASVLVTPSSSRILKPGRRTTKPRITRNELSRRYPTVVTIDRGNFRLRLFKGLKLAKAYGIAVGAAGYDTPTGLYRITNKAVNPAWSAPDRPWAGLYRGRSVPGGSPENPLKARWLGIVDGVGIHGTGDPGSIGSRASHGCIRMTVPSVIDLYGRVPVGTPVLIG